MGYLMFGSRDVPHSSHLFSSFDAWQKASFSVSGNTVTFTNAADQVNAAGRSYVAIGFR